MEERILSIISYRKSKTSSQNLRRLNKEKRFFKNDNQLKIQAESDVVCLEIN